jgi:UDP-N-acetylglucosamine acyltransferase
VIHSHALVDPAADIDPSAVIGAFSVIGPQVTIGPDTWIGPHVVIQGPTEIGRENRIYQFSSLGEAPQDRSYRGEPTRLVIGDRNVIRESVTLSRGTCKGHGVTRIGNDNLIMAYVHIAHDCIIGDRIIFSNAASLAGHVEIQNDCTLGGFTLVHQFCRVGAYAFTSMGSALNRDLPPYCLASGNYARIIGINKVGLRRQGFSEPAIQALHQAYRNVLRGSAERRERMAALLDATPFPEVRTLLSFVQESPRGILHCGRI